MQQNKKTVRIGLVGLSARGLMWLQNYLICPHCRVTALCDKFEALTGKGASIIAGHADAAPAECYTDYENMLRDARIDAVSLAVEPENNADMICAALAAGKHVICEVPLCYSIADCWRIVLAVEKHKGLKFQFGEQIRFGAFAQAWRTMVQEGKLGKAVYFQGQYLHGMAPNRFWHDSRTGARITFDETQAVASHKSRQWSLIHPMRYVPHELSPMLYVLKDRVVKVTGVGTRPQSYRYEWFPFPDIEVALMHTAQDTIIRLMAGFTMERLIGSEHQYRLIGTEGWVDHCLAPVFARKSGMMWLANGYMSAVSDVEWSYNTGWEMPLAARELGVPYSPQAVGSGHGGLDYWPVATFAQSIIEDKPVAMDVYAAVETAAPAIIAGECAEKGYTWMDVPDFRPGQHRQAGELPQESI